jgi:hypothetical protein
MVTDQGIWKPTLMQNWQLLPKNIDNLTSTPVFFFK